MSGDWIKVEHSTLEKPEVLRLSRLWGVSQDHALGVCVRFWVWLDNATVDGHVDGVGSHELDDMMRMNGFAQGLVAVGWLTIDEDRPRMSVPQFTEHNGETSKKRALNNKRQAQWRASNVDAHVDAQVDAHVDAHRSTTASTREEKRREDIKSKAKTTPKPPPTSSAPVGVRPEVWEAWRRVRGKKLTPDAVRLQSQQLTDYAAAGHDPNEVIEQSIRNTWAGLFPIKSNHAGASDAKHQRRTQTLDELTGRTNARPEPRIIEAES